MASMNRRIDRSLNPIGRDRNAPLRSLDESDIWVSLLNDSTHK
jgi:hypothetical protein